jgi:hypothetical protein
VFIQNLNPLTLSVRELSWVRTDGHGNLISPKAGLKTYSEQILEPSQDYEVHTILIAHIENMINLFHMVLVCVLHSFNPRGIRF